MDETDYLTISERVTNDWKEKLEVLRSHHRNQSREQQAQHLEELRVLQEDLLKDITHFMSKVKDEVEEEDSCFPPEEIMDESGEVNHLLQSVPVIRDKEQQDTITDTSRLDSPCLSKTVLPLPMLPDANSIASSPRVEHPQESAVDASFPSLKMHSMAYSNGTLTEPSVHTSPVAVASQALPNHREIRGQSKLLADVVNKLQDVVGIEVVEIEEEPSRTSQVAKFDRHLQDLKTFYESEILALKQKLSTMEKGGSCNDNDNSTTLAINTDGELDAGRGSDLDKKCGSSDKVAEGELKPSHTQSSLNSTCFHSSDCGTGGKMLDEFCKRLQDQLEDYEMENAKLRADNESITSQLRKLQMEGDTAEMKTKSLEEELKAVTQHSSKEKEKLEEEAEMLTCQLNKFRKEREQDLMNIDELLQEMEELQLENRELHNITIDCKMALEERNNEIESLKDTLKMHKATEDKYKSVILGLESDMRRLEHSRNRERSMQTHYTLGEDRKPRRIPKSHSSEHFLTPRHFPGSSPGKLKSLSSHTELTPPPLPLTPMKVATPMTNLKHGPNRSPGGSLDLDAQTPRTDVDRDVTTPTNFMPLTKKKWLESSDPGLFGVTTPTGRTSSGVSGGRTGKTSMQLSSSDVKIVDLEDDKPAKQQGVAKQRPSSTVPISKDSLEVENSEKVNALAESAVQAVKEKRVVGAEEASAVGKEKKMSYNDWWKKHMAVVARAETRLADLAVEKEQLESALQRAPKPGSIINRHEKRVQMERECRLEEVIQEMGRVRMTLKKHRAL